MLATALACCLLLAPAEPGLLFHAPFDGSAVAWSLSNQGQPADGPAPSFAPGKYGQALLAGAEVPQLRYPVAANILPASGTIAFWVQPQNWTPDDPHFHVFFETGQMGGKVGWLLFYKYYQNGWLLLRYADELERVGAATAVPKWQPGEWHHVAGTWSSAGLRIYLDGELAATAPEPRVGETLPETFALGDSGWHLPHAGARTLLDDFRIYATPLS
ncbi:MAG: LamG domain-containing protein, partial [Armatimonadetes bacterium]|nr:LamG domain-containing protein [Armatimonadota bacterium]